MNPWRQYYTGDNTLVIAKCSGNNLIASGGSVRYITIQAAELNSNFRGAFELNGSSYNGYCLKASTAGIPTGNTAQTMLGWVRIDVPSSVGASTHVFSYGRKDVIMDMVFFIRPSALYIDFHCGPGFL